MPHTPASPPGGPPGAPFGWAPVLRKPFYLDPSTANAHVLIVHYLNPHSSHSGLGINALHTVRVLRANMIAADAVGVQSADEIAKALDRFGDVTHCLIEAPWIATAQLDAVLLQRYPYVHFIIRVHSQIAFLQVEAGAIKLLREAITLQETRYNLTIAANSRKLSDWIKRAYTAMCLYLPNLYDLDRPSRKTHRPHDHRVLRIGSFGAIRLLKNHITAAAAALSIAKLRGNDLEFYITTNRQEHGRGVVDAIANLYKDVPYATLIQQQWQDWPQFRRFVANMDLCLQISFTETFNIVTADAAAEHVPSVVSSAIEWTPPYWTADVDSVDDVARTGSQLLSDQFAGQDGLVALEIYVQDAIRVWLAYLSQQPMTVHPLK